MCVSWECCVVLVILCAWWDRRSYFRGLEDVAALGPVAGADAAVALAVEHMHGAARVGGAVLEADGDAAGLGDGWAGVVVTVRVSGHQTPALPLTVILPELTPQRRLHLHVSYSLFISSE